MYEVSIVQYGISRLSDVLLSIVLPWFFSRFSLNILAVKSVAIAIGNGCEFAAGYSTQCSVRLAKR